MYMYRSYCHSGDFDFIMILAWLLIVTFVCGLLAWLVSLRSHLACRLVCFAGLAVDAALILYIWINQYDNLAAGTNTGRILEYKTVWIAPLAINFHLAMDGLSLLLAALTILLGICSVAASWKEIREHTGAFHFVLMAVLTGVLGVFTAVNLFLFYFFWELMLVPMFFLILIWGHENRVYAAIKFFIFTQAGGLFMLLSIIGLYWFAGRNSGQYTFDYPRLLSSATDWSFFIVLGFFIAFAVKLPVVPAHIWLPDAHTEAPTAGSVMLAGVLLKTGAYGLIRFVLPALTATSSILTNIALLLGLVGIFYGALLAFGQREPKRFVAYTSISHLGFVLIGIFACNQMALQGAVIIMLAHGLSTGALFIIIGQLRQRFDSPDMTEMGGLWPVLPRMGAMMLFFVLASLGLPGLANFIGEFLVLAGTFQAYPRLAGVAAFGFVASSIYSLWIFYQIFHGPVKKTRETTDLGFGEMMNLSVLAAAIIWIGLFPQTVLTTAKTSLENIKFPQSAKLYEGSREVKNIAITIAELEDIKRSETADKNDPK
jgi:NADH-quinone oxidoreductase subunit M